MTLGKNGDDSVTSPCSHREQLKLSLIQLDTLATGSSREATSMNLCLANPGEFFQRTLNKFQIEILLPRDEFNARNIRNNDDE